MIAALMGGRHRYLLFNEESSPVTVKLDLAVIGQRLWLNPVTAEETSAAANEAVVFSPHELKVVSLDQAP